MNVILAALVFGTLTIVLPNGTTNKLYATFKTVEQCEKSAEEYKVSVLKQYPDATVTYECK